MNPKLGIVLLFITFLSFSAAATLERVLRTSGTPPQPPYHHHQGSSAGVKYGSGYGSYYHPRAKCPKLSAPVGGKVNVTGQYLGHKAIYSCNKGYVLVGFHIRLCIGNGTWSGMAPICKRVNCGPLPHIANGAVSIHPDTRLGSTATYTCNSGYKLVGNDTRTCLANGKWSGQEPVCRPVDCGDLDNPMNGWVHISPNTLFGGQALYRCKLGYELSSDVVRTCQASGQWSGSAPTCDPIDCGPQPEPDPNGSIKATQGTSLRNQTAYQCNAGYTLEGSETIYCQNDGTYSDKAPTCQRIDCGDLSDIANGEVSIAPDTMLGSNATYSCNDGYTLQGDSVRTCQASGQWSGSEPTCTPVDCGDLDNPENGWVHISPNTLLGGQALYRCKLGYELSSDVVRTCQASGQWSGSAPTCDPIDCGDQPTSDPNGQIESTEGTSLGDKTTYSCNTGYFLVGSATIYCQNDKTYSDDAPTCQPVDCGAPDPADPNGSIHFTTTTLGSRVVYRCNKCFNIVGKSVSVCQANGLYSNPAPVCKPVDCGVLPAPKNGGVTFYPGTYFTSTATFRCKKGFKLTGSEVRTCQCDGTWSGEKTGCQKIQCPKLKPPQYGRIYTSGQYPGDYAVYSCGYGYSLSGKSRRVCLHNGQWSGSPAQCKKDDHYGGYYGGGYGGSYKEHEY
ncbi:PREDICTED: CUB and sushi domain-containing protein 1-like isoform X3 [Amphimedon queenslandica]|uniref:Sushi domain-containing protein n=1 Tax=Amphimedon queenslandica TaxID=400682 RepID=A0AAN0K3D7_AMPQE|nr:PREDICTED: CUB and sushi domain-containing protein 1-like isoform X3 [Amphimedon queenslandica]|eukprot:XP_019863662.1 PREDICTED: CUB and sushi domain-containing protein 1-like isoform X3 [Amphimedon queenslandica]